MAEETHARPLDCLLEGGTVVLGSGRFRAALGVRAGRIAWIGAEEEAPPAEETFDLAGRLILPGAIDPHVHFRTRSINADSLAGVARSAAHGGTTTIVPFATGEEGESMTATLHRVREEGEGGSVVDFTLHAWVFEDFEYLADIPKAIDAGVTSFKIMMGYRKRGYGRCIPDDYTFAAMESVGRHGGIALVHAENGLVIDYLENQVWDEELNGTEFLRRTRPPELKAEATARSIRLADFAKCPLYIVHLTAAAAYAEAGRARAEGKDVIVETCPQYLICTDAAVTERGALAKVAPPLRGKEDNRILWTGLQEGKVDLLGSDHSPYTQAVKNDGPFAQAPFGAPGVETFLPLLYSEGVAAGRITAERLVQITSENAARVLGLYPQKGTLLIGSDADIAVINPEGKTVVRAAEQHTNADYSLYEDRELRGKVEMSMVRGEVVLQAGKLEQKPGFGQFIPRRRAGGRAALRNPGGAL